MRIKLVLLAAITMMVFMGTACQKPATESPAPEAALKSSCDRACLEKYVDQYMDAMLSHTPGSALFAKDCRFTENGAQLPLGDEGRWASMVGKGDYKFYVPDVETQQIAYIGTAKEESDKNEAGDPVAIALRLKIQGGLITEAEQLVLRADSAAGASFPPAGMTIDKLGAPHKAYAEMIPEAERPSREELIKTANKYFSGMQKNDGKGDYPFADDCERLENGVQTTHMPLKPGEKKPDYKTATAYSASWGCKEQFESGMLHFVSRIRDRRFVAVDRERGIVFAFGFFDHGAGKTRHFKTPAGKDVVLGPVTPWTWQIAELFKIEKGKIRRIEAVSHKCPYGMNSGWSTYEKGWSDEAQIVR
jgi:hypothetical protein